MSEDFYMLSIKGKKVKVGEINGVIFTKNIQFSKHFFRKSSALGIDVKLLNAIVEKGVTGIVLLDTESGKRYETTVERFMQKGWNYPKEGDQFYGKFQPQHFLALNRWTIIDVDGNVLQTGEEMESETREREKRAKAYDEKEAKRAEIKAQKGLF